MSLFGYGKYGFESELYSAVDRYADLGADGVLSAGEVLRGFELPLTKVFAKLDRAF